MRIIRIVLLLYIFAISMQLKAQTNLVPNYSFEEKDSCGDGWRGIDLLCKDWFTPLNKMDTIFNPYTPKIGSSDYFNTCNHSNTSVPNNNSGYQQPLYGNAYSGIFVLGIIHTPNYPYHNAKEYIEVKLKSRLSKNRKYCVEFYYSLADDYFNYHSISIGALISDTLVKRTPHPLFYYTDIRATPQINAKLPTVPDTSNWVKVSGSFIAKGGEQYITIGNFENTDNIYNSAHYVYIDDVKLWYCGPDTMLEPADSMVIPNVFTPNGDGYNDKFIYKNQEQWKFETQVFNRWGELVFDNKNSENWDGYFNGNKVSAGVYYYLIKAEAIRNGEIHIYRGTITLMY